MEKILFFGRVLQQSREKTKKSLYEIALKLSVSDDVVNKWENGISFPEEFRLALIASVYGLGQKKLRIAYQISKDAREEEKQLRRSLKRGRNASSKPSGGEIRIDIESFISKSVFKRHS